MIRNIARKTFTCIYFETSVIFHHTHVFALFTIVHRSVGILSSCVQKNNNFFTLTAILNVSEVKVLYCKMSWSGDRRRPRVSGFIRAFGDQAFKVI